jgi:hypothetical protein
MPRRPNDLTPIDPGTPTDSATTPRVRPAAAPSAHPGARSETPSDNQLTRRIPRLGRRDPTPAPLPPSPGARDAERWFEQVPTNPAHIAELAERTGSHRKARPSSQVSLLDRPAPLTTRPWLLLTLIAAIALTIGLILGALLFGGASDCAPCEAPGSGQAPKQ